MFPTSLEQERESHGACLRRAAGLRSRRGIRYRFRAGCGPPPHRRLVAAPSCGGAGVGGAPGHPGSRSGRRGRRQRGLDRGRSDSFAPWRPDRGRGPRNHRHRSRSGRRHPRHRHRPSDRALAARLNPDGSVDESFDLGLSGDQVRTAIAEPDGRFILGGNFGTFGTAGLARFDSRGIQDGTLAASLYDVTAVRLDTNGGLLVGGGFTTVNNVSQPHLARLFGGSIQRRSVAWSSPYVSVGENGSHPVLTIRRGGDSSEPLSVHVHPLQATASPGLDFDAAVQTVTLERGVNSAETVIPILDDGLVEGDETFYVELRDPTPGVMVALSSRARIDLGDDEISSMLDIGFFPRLSGAVTAAAFQSDGKVLVAGEFNWVDDAERNRFARL
ncbi:MAG: hypothetical protein HUU22_16180, partial [Phycisphaerae bacterium]|nr:hypothetical protein [Phycisphaerae bacterium]